MSQAALAHTPKLPTVTIQDNYVMADSRDVAAYFEKDHRHVLRAVHNAHCSNEFRLANFGPIKIRDLTGETTSHVMMTKDGFAFIGFGFTGKKAGAFKEAWILAFNEMEARLRGTPAQLPAPEPQEPDFFEPGSDLLRDLHYSVRSAFYAVHNGKAADPMQALGNVLEDLIALRDNPAHRMRSTVLDWNYRRGNQQFARQREAEARRR